MYSGDNFRIIDKETFEFRMPEGREMKILQMTDLHLGFGWMARKLDRKAMEDVTTIVERTKPDLIVFTGDTIFPFLATTLMPPRIWNVPAAIWFRRTLTSRPFNAT